MTKIVKRPAAWQDLVDHVDFLSQRSPGTAHRFIDAVEETFSFLADHPLLGGLCAFEHPQARDLRRWSIRGFRHYVVFYRDLADGIEVVRLLHTAQDAPSQFGDRP